MCKKTKIVHAIYSLFKHIPRRAQQVSMHESDVHYEPCIIVSLHISGIVDLPIPALLKHDFILIFSNTSFYITFDWMHLYLFNAMVKSRDLVWALPSCKNVNQNCSVIATTTPCSVSIVVPVFFVSVQSFALACASVSASTKLYSALVDAILRAPISFFDTTPIGRIVNRFAKDMDIVDSTLPTFISMCLIAIVPLVSTIGIILYSLPVFAAIFLPFAAIVMLVKVCIAADSYHQATEKIIPCYLVGYHKFKPKSQYKGALLSVIMY